MRFREALKIAENFIEEQNSNLANLRLARLSGIIPKKSTLSKTYGETPNKYVFIPCDSEGSVPPGGGAITVDKETGECKYEYLERDGIKPWSPIKDYREIKIDVAD